MIHVVDQPSSEAGHSYRKFLADPARFCQLVQMEDEELVQLIHQTFRAQYLKDVILPRILDDETFATLVMMIRCNYSRILAILDQDEEGEFEDIGEDETKIISAEVVENHSTATAMPKEQKSPTVGKTSKTRFFSKLMPLLQSTNDDPLLDVQICRFFKEYLQMCKASMNAKKIRFFR